MQITRADNAADIDLGTAAAVTTWARYASSRTFVDAVRSTGLLGPGQLLHEGKLDRLRESLTKLDYFSVIDIQPRPDQADENGEVPVDVKLTRAKRTISPPA